MIALAGVAVPLATAGVNALNAPNAKDAERFAKADAWYQRAIAGDAVALCYLKYMGGLRGSSSCGGDPAAGFATATSKTYCEQLYQQALKVLAGVLSPGAATPPPPQASPAGGAWQQSIAQAAAQTSSTTASLAGALGQTPTTSTQQKLSDVLTYGKYAFIIGGLALLAFMVYRKVR